MVIYVITNHVDGKKYVGKTSQTAEFCWNQHMKTMRQRSNYPLYRAMLKYGTSQFSYEVVATAESEPGLNALEIQWIVKLDTGDRIKGYNVTSGGESMSSYKHRADTKVLRIQLKPRRKLSPEHRDKLGAARLGKKHSAETIRKMQGHWGETRRDYQGEVVRRVNAIENAKLKDYTCDRCHKSFTQVTKGVFGGHRKACLAKTKTPAE